MKKLLLAGLLAALALTALPNQSMAGNRNPYKNYGMGWLGSLAIRTRPGIFYEGPLFNYGPYNTQGLVVMHIPQPYHGSYTPADPTLWNRGYMPNPQYGATPGPFYYGSGPGYMPYGQQPAMYGNVAPAGYPQR
jgi:hypothetical protein